MDKILRLSQELSIPIHCVGVARTNNAINEHLTRLKSSVSITFSTHNEWDELRDLRKFVNENDLIVFISARRGELSYRYSFDRIPKKLEKVYHQHNRILIFPRRRGGRSLDEFEEVPTTPLFQRIGRGIGSIFNKERDG